MDALNKMLFAFASYNAGPGRIIKLRQEAQQSGFNPNIWFRNVEIIAARQIGRETVQYVGNIYKYYIAYRRIVKDFGQKKERKSGQI
jgi:membrane-bound lytic murein transglycosylase MltF